MSHGAIAIERNFTGFNSINGNMKDNGVRKCCPTDLISNEGSSVVNCSYTSTCENKEDGVASNHYCSHEDEELASNTTSTTVLLTQFIKAIHTLT